MMKPRRLVTSAKQVEESALVQLGAKARRKTEGAPSADCKALQENLLDEE